MGKNNEPLIGFSWRTGMERETKGVVMWSDVFLYTNKDNGEKIAIFVMDFQGLFDKELTQSENAKIFTLQMMMSSINIINLKDQINMEQLQYLEFAVELSKLLTFKAKDRNLGSRENLTFLCRDWNYYETYNFGIDGGKKYLNENIRKKFKKEILNRIENSFKNIDCWLFPDPGKIVTSSNDYNGCWSKMDPLFMEETKKSIKYILSPQNMELKMINSRYLIGKELNIFFIECFKLIQLDVFPTFISNYNTSVESHLNNFIGTCVKKYETYCMKLKKEINN